MLRAIVAPNSWLKENISRDYSLALNIWHYSTVPLYLSRPPFLIDNTTRFDAFPESRVPGLKGSSPPCRFARIFPRHGGRMETSAIVKEGSSGNRCNRRADKRPLASPWIAVGRFTGGLVRLIEQRMNSGRGSLIRVRLDSGTRPFHWKNGGTVTASWVPARCYIIAALTGRKLVLRLMSTFEGNVECARGKSEIINLLTIAPHFS